MGLQLLAGGAGSGKTTFLMEKVIKDSMEHPEKRFFYLVPEQYTAEIEDELIRRHERKGLLNIEVLSMTRLAYRIFGECGTPSGIVLDDNGKNMLLTRVARENEERLPVLGAQIKKPGYIAEMKSVISEWTEYRVESGVLDAFCTSDKSFLGKKIRDLLTVYEAFESAMAGRFYMAEELLMLLVPKVSKSELIKGSVIVLDGYTGFTPTQRPLVRELLQRAEMVFAAVTIDNDGGLFEKASEEDVFSLSKGMIRDLMEAAKETDMEVLKPIVFKEDLRHNKKADLKFLSEHFLKKGGEIYRGVPSGIEVVKATSPEAECMLAAEQIRRLVRTENYRYRDIAVIMGDESGYSAPLERAFEVYSIPGFFDAKRSILKNPACELVRSLLNMADRGYDRESIMRFMRCGLVELKDIDIFAVDEFENYILAHGIRNYGAYRDPFEQTAGREEEGMLLRVNKVREAFVKATEDFRDVFKKPRKTAGEMTQAILKCLSDFAIEERLKNLSSAFKEAGKMTEAMEFDQVYGILLEALETFETLLGNEVMTTGEYRELLEAAFSEAGVGLIPLERDMVLAGDLIRTRLSNVKAVFILGADDTALPGEVRKNGILSESDREKMKRGGISLAPGAREKAYIQLFYLYQQLSKAEERLILSYSALGMDGKVRRPASLVTGICRMFPEISVQVPEYEDVSKREFVPETGMEAFLRELQKAEQDEENLPPSAKDLYGTLKACAETREKFREIKKQKDISSCLMKLKKSTAEELYGDLSSCGVTRLERYAVCAFAHFMRYGIEAFPRREYGFDPADWGNISHKVLELYSDKVKLAGKDFGDVRREEQMALVDICLEESLRYYDNKAIYQNKRTFHQVERLKDMLQRNILVLTRQIAAGDFKPAGFEVPFKGGKIDRVDICKRDSDIFVKVIDYKTGRKSFALPEVYGGISLQLPVYLQEALRASQKAYPNEIVRPAGLFYYHIDDPIITVKDESEDVQKEILKKLRPDGLFVGDGGIPELYDRDMGSNSLVLKAGRKKDGSLSAVSKYLSGKDMNVMPVYAKKLATNIRKNIMNGEISARPYELEGKTPCTYCPYKPVCRFDNRLPGYNYRRLENGSDEIIIGKMKEALDEC